jgi:hypothetical protein
MDSTLRTTDGGAGVPVTGYSTPAGHREACPESGGVEYPVTGTPGTSGWDAGAGGGGTLPAERAAGGGSAGLASIPMTVHGEVCES